MANHHASALFFAALILSAAASPSRGADLLLNGISVSGQLCCTSTGNCPGQGVAGAKIVLNCTGILGGVTTVGEAITNATGLFTITAPVLGLIFGLIPCNVGVQLPLDAAVCPVLSTSTGVLSSAVQSVGTVVSSILGPVLNATTAGFSHLGL